MLPTYQLSTFANKEGIVNFILRQISITISPVFYVTTYNFRSRTFKLTYFQHSDQVLLKKPKPIASWERVLDRQLYRLDPYWDPKIFQKR